MGLVFRRLAVQALPGHPQNLADKDQKFRWRTLDRRLGLLGDGVVVSRIVLPGWR